MKQLKVRYGTFSHDADNVIIYEIEKVDAFLQFVFRGYSTEKEHLKKLGDNESSQRDCQILQFQRSKEDRNAAVPSVPLSQQTGSGTMGQVGQHGTSGTVRETKQAELFTGYGKEENKA